MHAAQGLEFDHVYVLGLHAARMPGARRRTLEPIPDALLKEALPRRPTPRTSPRCAGCCTSR